MTKSPNRGPNHDRNLRICNSDREILENLYEIGKLKSGGSENSVKTVIFVLKF